ncbi:tetratricopeptide repeat protein [Cupriavidus pinatubonensis]|uniref:tetratricopeptide repeat protein n=1 Tax=Cupriavidus pinatubonensis TaxID=248026 RepID=UPI001125DCA5|nr:tetratricopeptide repeat protein [Cupriavidus pinatubonensis]TPQ30926.1 hypothetical protein C2U69_30010 [Cupriavidus pinatubonensis]
MSREFSEVLECAERGDADAQFAVAEAYRMGKDVNEDLAEALRWYRAAAIQGHAAAQNNLGTMYLNGIGVDNNPAEAAHWYRLAAEQGEEVAQFNLAMRYLHGQGVEQSDVEAVGWFAQAAEHGHIEAIGELGTMYRFGRGVPRDIAAAARYHMMAAMDGDITSIGNLLSYQNDIERAALGGSALAVLCLAQMYEKGLPVKKDLAQAYAWLAWGEENCDRSDDPDTEEEWDDVDQSLSTSVSDTDKERAAVMHEELSQRAAELGLQGKEDEHAAAPGKAMEIQPRNKAHEPPNSDGTDTKQTSHQAGYDYYEFGDEDGNLMMRKDGALYRLDRNTGTWVLDGHMISYLYGGDSEAISEEEAKALAKKLCPARDVRFD